MRLVEQLPRLRGRVHLIAYEGDVEYVQDEDTGLFVPANPVVWEQVKNNLIVTVGKRLLMDRLYGLGGAAALGWTGVGTSNTAAAVGNTGLTGGVWKAFDSTPVRTAGTVRSVSTYGTAEANITIAEAALGNASSGGTILNRLAPIGPYTKTTAVSLAVTVDVNGG